MSSRMQEILHIVGAGRKSARDMTADEAADAMRLVMSGEATPAQIGALMLALRLKGETAEELAAFVKTCQGFCRPLSPAVENVLDVAAPYDGKRRTFQVLPVAGLIAAAAGVPVLLHGDRDLPPNYGVGPGDVLRALGVETELPNPLVERILEATGFGYVSAAQFCPALHQLAPLRRELDVRVSFHQIEKLLSPLARPGRRLIGVYHQPSVPKLAAAIALLEGGPTWIVQGSEGSPDFPLHRSTKAWQAAAGETRGLEVEPWQVGLFQPVEADHLADAGAHVEATLSVLHGEPGPWRDLALLNAGFLIWIGGAAGDIASGITLAARALDIGLASRRLADLRHLTSIAGARQ